MSTKIKEAKSGKAILKAKEKSRGISFGKQPRVKKEKADESETQLDYEKILRVNKKQ